MMRMCMRFLSIAAVVGSHAAAQTTPVVLVHGFYSDATTWDSTVTLLASTGNYSPSATGAIDWTQHLAVQGAALASYLSTVGFGTTNTILVGHSQGGLVSRLATRSRQVFGIMSIGTPHQGVPIVQAFSAIEGNLALADADFYDAYDNLQDEIGCNGLDDPICDDVVPGLDYLSAATSLVLAALTVGDEYASWRWSDLADLAPTSTVILDSLETGYGAEQASSRLSIVCDDDDEDAGPFRLIAGATAAEVDAGLLSSYGMVIGFSGVGIELDDDSDTDPNYFAHTEAGFDMEEVGGLMVNFSDLYNGWVGSYSNDGLVPTYSQQMPNSAKIPIGNVSHTEETLQAVTIKNGLDNMTGR